MLHFYRISTNLLFSLLYIKLARQQQTISALNAEDKREPGNLRHWRLALSLTR